MNRSRTIMLLMLVVAAGFAAVSVAFHHAMTHLVIHWWGLTETRLVMDAPKVEALRLAPRLPERVSRAEAVAEESLALPGGKYGVLERRDVTAAGGLTALRHGLLEDANFDWSDDSPPGPHEWQFALVFSDGPKSRQTVLFDFKNRLMANGETGVTVPLAESAANWQKFFTEVFAALARRATVGPVC